MRLLFLLLVNPQKLRKKIFNSYFLLAGNLLQIYIYSLNQINTSNLTNMPVTGGKRRSKHSGGRRRSKRAQPSSCALGGKRRVRKSAKPKKSRKSRKSRK